MPTWSSPFSSWHERALPTPHPDPHAFTPTRDDLLLAVLLNAQAEGDGISLALFSQTGSDDAIAVDASGRVLYVSAKDADGILALAKETSKLPKASSFWNTWTVKHTTTCRPNDRLFVRAPSNEGFHQTTVYGFSKGIDDARRGVHGAA